MDADKNRIINKHIAFQHIFTSVEDIIHCSWFGMFFRDRFEWNTDQVKCELDRAELQILW